MWATISENDPRWIPISEAKNIGGKWYLILFNDGHIEECTAYRLTARNAVKYMVHPDFILPPGGE